MFRPLLCALACVATAAAQPPTPPAKATAPDGTAPLSDTLTGSYVVAAPLKAKYDDLLARLDTLKRDLDAGRVAGPDALKSLADLRASLKELREQLDKSKVLVPVVESRTRTDTVSFDIGPERSVVVTAGRVRVVGTDGDKIVCTLEKAYLGGDAKEADAELAAIKVVHRHGPQPEVVGKSPAEWDAEEEAFRQSPDGRKLTPEQRAGRAKLVESIRASWGRYRDFQAKPIDAVHVEGLTGQEGNRQMALQLASAGGQSNRSVWRRHATLTVAVPKSRRVAVRGARAGLEVAGVQGSLLITNDGEHDRDYDATFRVKGVRGDVTVLGFPLRSVEEVSGSVSITALEDFANSGTRHDFAGRASFRSRPVPCAIRDIGGDLRAHFGRADLRVEGVRGALVVENDAGDTQVVVTTPLAAAAAHRVTTVSGTVTVSFAAGALGDLPLVAATSHGTFRTDAPQGEFPTFALGGGPDGPRGWQGVHRVTTKDPQKQREVTSRLPELLRPEDQSPGLVVRTLAGHLVVTVAAK